MEYYAIFIVTGQEENQVSSYKYQLYECLIYNIIKLTLQYTRIASNKTEAKCQMQERKLALLLSLQSWFMPICDGLHAWKEKRTTPLPKLCSFPMEHSVTQHFAESFLWINSSYTRMQIISFPDSFSLSDLILAIEINANLC